MRLIKRLHIFILKSFLPLFAMTFFIVLFIVLMQFLWKYIGDMVGKGLSFDVLAELFFYAAVSMVPMALPLAILLASLMTFGNFGEKFELTAMKAAGISLVQVMAPLIFLIGGIAVGAFFFQNNVLPTAQVRMWTLLFSMKQKSPEVDIPEGVFYDQIPGYNLFVKSKNSDTGTLYNLMIYDVSRGSDNSTIVLADSARLAFTPDMHYLYLHLWQGEQFENLRDQSGMDRNVPFRREHFADKQLLIPFDANFNRMDDNAMRKQYVGKNIAELRHTIDSVTARIDSTGREYAGYIASELIATSSRPTTAIPLPAPLPERTPAVAGDKSDPAAFNLDSLITRLPESRRRLLFSTAVNELQTRQANAEFKAADMADDKKSLRRHQIELIKKFTLSVACLIFFFIGAPLGAIIRKGGIGTPLVISVLLFLVYYIIDNTGYKMARDGRWIVWMGMWLSTAILAPLGLYVTYKAMNDSAVFDIDLYRNLLRKAFGLAENRSVEYKEVIINDVPIRDAIARINLLRDNAHQLLERYPRPQGYLTYWNQGFDTDALRRLSGQLESDVTYMTDCRNLMAVNKLIDYPVLRNLWIYRPARRKWISRTFAAIFPIGVPVWLAGLRAQRNLKADLRHIVTVSDAITGCLNDELAKNAETPDIQDSRD